jgi:DNA-binding NarL/FixJ family response regulator
MRVLLVDDHQLLLEGLKKLLELHGIEIAGMAKNGLEAVAKCKTIKPDIILMDIRMPELDGLGATRLIKAEMPEAKIVMLTTSSEDKDLFEAIKSGACGYLLKSMDADDLIEALEQAIEGIPPFSPGLAAKLMGEFARITNPQQPEPPQGQIPALDAKLENGLTARQSEVLALVSQGLGYKEVGSRLGVSTRTIKYHMAEIMQKLHLQNRAQAITYAANLELRGDKPVK